MNATTPTITTDTDSEPIFTGAIAHDDVLADFDDAPAFTGPLGPNGEQVEIDGECEVGRRLIARICDADRRARRMSGRGAQDQGAWLARYQVRPPYDVAL